MPYTSDAQRRFFHSPGAKKAGISPGVVNEFDKTSKGMDLPEKAPNQKPRNKFPKMRKTLGGIK